MCGQCCVTGLLLWPSLGLDIFIEILLGNLLNRNTPGKRKSQKHAVVALVRRYGSGVRGGGKRLHRRFCALRHRLFFVVSVNLNQYIRAG